LNSNPEISESELIHQYQATDDHTYVAKSYQKYMPMVYGTCLKYLKNNADAKDAMMSIYELISKKLKTHQVDNFKSWLYVLTKNYCLDILRKKSRRLDKKETAELMYSEQIYHPDSVAYEKEMILHECIEKLKTEQKQIIKLFYFDKLSYRVIAERLNIEWSKVRSQIQNGRRMLKNCIEKNASK